MASVRRTEGVSLSSLYEIDETAWLETMARLVTERRYDELDHDHLSEFLADMARRDKREVLSRLTILLMHLLKWDHQPDHRSRSWKQTIVEQRDELKDLFESRTLEDYRREALPKAYERAMHRASIESGLDETVFPQTCTRSLEQIVDGELPD